MDSLYTSLVVIVVVYVGVVNGQSTMLDNVALLAGQEAKFLFIRPVGRQAVNWYTYTTGEKQILFFNGTDSYSGSGSIGNRSSAEVTTNGTHVMHELIIKDVEIADGGTYSTEDILAAGSTIEVFMEIIFLEHDLDCYVSPNPAEAGFAIYVTCTLPYRGRWGVVVTCNGTRIEDPGIADMSQDGVSEYFYNGTVLPGEPAGSVECEAHFESPTTEEYPHLALNIPDYTSTWNSSFSIHYPATMISVSSNNTEYDVGDTITCLATGGNPAPTYKWVDENGYEDLTLTDKLTITADMAGVGYNATCFAVTTILGLEYELLESISFYVNELPTTTTTTTTTTQPTTLAPQTTATTSDKRKVDKKLLVIIIVATVAGLLGLALIVTLIVCCVKKGRKSADLTKI